jgi:hypothetical protein
MRSFQSAFATLKQEPRESDADVMALGRYESASLRHSAPKSHPECVAVVELRQRYLINLGVVDWIIRGFSLRLFGDQEYSCLGSVLSLRI